MDSIKRITENLLRIGMEIAEEVWRLGYEEGQKQKLYDLEVKRKKNENKKK